MRKIKSYLDQVCDELGSAKCYAESYVEYKAQGDSAVSSRFHQMAEDELKHAEFIHGLAVSYINRIGEVFKAPLDMQHDWEESHAKYVEKSAWIRQMLSM